MIIRKRVTVVLEKYEYQPEAIEIFAFVEAGIGDT